MNMKTKEILTAVEEQTGIAPYESLSDVTKQVIDRQRHYDIVARDSKGKEYFIRVKQGRCHSVILGSMLEMAARTLEINHSATIVLVCQSIDPAVRQMFEKTKIKVVELKSLGSGRTALHEDGLDHLTPLEQRAYFKMLRNDMRVIDTSRFSKLMQLSHKNAANLLNRMTRKRVLFRIGRGRHIVLPPEVISDHRGYTADPLLLLNDLIPNIPFYVAYSSAAKVLGVTIQIPLVTYVAVKEQRRPIDLKFARIEFIRLRSSFFFGFEERNYFGSTIFCSDLEKTILDCIDRPELMGGVDFVTQLIAESFDEIDYDKLLGYCKKSDRKVIIQRLGFILKKLSLSHRKVPRRILTALRNLQGRTYPYRIDPRMPKRGKLHEDWNIYENVDILSWENE